MEGERQQTGRGGDRPSGGAPAQRQAQTRRVVFGVTLVAAGVLLLILGLPIFSIFELWPLLLVGLGASRVFGACCGNRRRSGFWLLGIGLWFTVNELTGLRYHDTWPLLLVIVGVLLMWDALSPTDHCAACAEGHHAR